MVLCFIIWLKPRAHPSPPRDTVFRSGRCFQFLPSLKLSSIKEFVSVISFYILTMLFVSGLIEGGDEWRKKKIKPERKMKEASNRRKHYSGLHAGWKCQHFYCRSRETVKARVAHLQKECLLFLFCHLEVAHCSCESFLPSGYTIIIKT